MSGTPPVPARPSPARPSPAVYFASDYGTVDEFVGVVHAVLHRFAPGVPVIDLSHGITPFDVAAGAELLVRCAPALGPGVVLAVVDPTVGSERRALALRLAQDAAGRGPDWLVGPDNGLLLPLAAACGGVETAYAIERSLTESHGWPALSAARTFDGRDLFSPAAAHLVGGGDPGLLGPETEPSRLAPAPTRPRAAVSPDGELVARVRWIDRFGNLQLELVPADLERAAPTGGPAPSAYDLVVEAGSPAPGTHRGFPRRVRRVPSFSSLPPGEVGLVVDANGYLALAADREPAARLLGGVGAGDRVRLRPARS